MRFVVVYQREPHARQLAFADVPQPTTRDERVVLARRLLDEQNLDVDVWIDEGDASRAAFGDLPNWAIVIDPAGAVHLKLPWADPTVLAKALVELEATLPELRPSPRDAGFLTELARAAAGDDPGARHDRQAMLALLAARHPDHPDRDTWLAELAAPNCPPQQRAWVARLRRPAAPPAEVRPPRRDDGAARR